MQLESLKIFCDVVRYHSFSRGAAANEVSQPAASQVVHQIEKRLGAKLIDRSRRPWALTEEGRIYFEECQVILDRYDKLEAELRQRRKSPEYTVRVSAIYSVGFGDLGRYVEQFRKEVPGSDVQLEYVHPNQVYESVANDEAELGLISFPHPGRDLTVIPWRSDPMVLVCHPDHVFSGRGEVDPRELGGHRLVTFERGMVIRKELDRYLRQYNVDVRVVGEFDNVDTIKRAVEDGLGLAILPKPTIRREIDVGSLLSADLRGEPLVRPLAIIHRRRRPLNSAVERLIEILQGPNGKSAGENGKLTAAPRSNSSNEPAVARDISGS